MNKKATAIFLIIVLLVLTFTLSACNSPKNKFYKTTIGGEEYVALFYHEVYSSQNLSIYRFDASTQRWTRYDLGSCLAKRYTTDSGWGIIIPDTVIYINSRDNYTAYRLVERIVYHPTVYYDINNPSDASAFRILIETRFD